MDVMPVDRPDPARDGVTIRSLDVHDFDRHAADFIEIYLSAMRYPAANLAGRRTLWQEHSRRAGFGCAAAFDPDGLPLAFAYGYAGQPGQWWNSEVRRGLSDEQAARWMTSYLELTELHVHPAQQGRGLGETVLRTFLAGREEPHVLLSTPEGENRAWRLYRRLGFGDLLRQHRFTGDPRPFGILGRPLPLDH